MALLPEMPESHADSSQPDEVDQKNQPGNQQENHQSDQSGDQQNQEDSFSVSLSVFSGPFDVLLGLIAAHKLELTRVSLSQVSDEFIDYVSHLSVTQSADAISSFLLVASVLVEAKSVSLLPGDASRRDSEDMDALRARDLLFARLLQYRAFKQAADAFGEQIRHQAGFHPHPAQPDPRFNDVRHRVNWQMRPEDFALLAANVFLNALRSTVSLSQLHVPQADMREQSRLVKEKLSTANHPLLFSDLVADADDRGVVVARFLAILIFFKLRFLQFRQDDAFSPLSLRWVASEDEYQAHAAQIGSQIESETTDSGTTSKSATNMASETVQANTVNHGER